MEPYKFVLIVRSENQENDSGYNARQVAQSTGDVIAHAWGTQRLSLLVLRRRWCIARGWGGHSSSAIRAESTACLGSTIWTKCHNFIVSLLSTELEIIH
jgi:hypothetical protein